MHDEKTRVCRCAMPNSRTARIAFFHGLLLPSHVLATQTNPNIENPKMNTAPISHARNHFWPFTTSPLSPSLSLRSIPSSLLFSSLDLFGFRSSPGSPPPSAVAVQSLHGEKAKKNKAGLEEKGERQGVEKKGNTDGGESMCDLVARTGRHQQRYEAGCRLVAGCIPFRYRNCDDTSNDKLDKEVEVLMINSPSGPGLLFPKGGWENDETVEEAATREALEEAGVRGDIVSFLGDYFFKSKTLQDEFSPEGLCKAAVFAMQVTEELESWPEQSTRHRSWVTLPEAMEQCRHPWMHDALHEGFSKWHDGVLIRPVAEVTPKAES